MSRRTKPARRGPWQCSSCPHVEDVPIPALEVWHQCPRRDGDRRQLAPQKKERTR